LDDIVAGRAEPKTAQDACLLAEMCRLPFQKRYAAAARLYEMAFVADPALADDLESKNRFEATRSVIRAATGEGLDSPAGAAERAALRLKAVSWLRADLVLRKKQAESHDPDQQRRAAHALSLWMTTASFAALRPGFPGTEMTADERAKWYEFWAEVEAVRAIAARPIQSVKPKP
jgi:hypothetical protein